MNKLFTLVLLASILGFSACSTRGVKRYSHTTSYSESKGSYSGSVDKKNYSHPTMRPYTVRGVKYYPTVVHVGDEFRGNASWYGPDFHGKLTSNGEKYNMHDMTAAHKTLPMNTVVKVTNENNGLSTVVRINDRGPFVATRIIDLSNAAAKKIDMIGTGTAPVTLEVIGFANQNSKKHTSKKKQTYAQTPSSSGEFALQIASFSNIEGAIKTQEEFDGIDGYKAVIKDIENENGRIFKVWLKGFKSEQEARDYKAQSSFTRAFIVRED